MAFPLSPTPGQLYTTSKGTQYSWDNVQGVWFISGQTIVGLTGVQGPTGVQGQIGSTGVQGQIGLTGVQGSTGVQGQIGSTGVQGQIGLTGAQGPTGVQGQIGSTGVQGQIGLTGVQGQIGLTGVQGPTGVQGQIGSTGVAGLGSTGVQGSAGAAGGSTGVMVVPMVSASSIAAGIKADICMPFNFQFTNWTFAGSPTGVMYFDVLKTTYAGFPTSLATMTSGGSTGVAGLSNTVKNQGTTAGWNSTGVQGDMVEVKILGAPSGTTVATLTLNYNRTS